MTETKPAHSRIGASTMHRWGVCPGSVRLSRGIPNKSSKYAEEGTRAHELAALVLATRLGLTLSPKEEADLARMLGDKDGYPEDMHDAVEVYVSTVLDDRSHAHDSAYLIEHRFDLSSVHPGLFGTADCVGYHRKKNLLRIYDYKHGQGIAVDVEQNEQLMYYGLGALLTTGFKAGLVELVIVQPRCAHSGGVVRRWRFDALDMLDFAAVLAEKARATEDPNAPLVDGDHCRFCPAAPTCPKLAERANQAAVSVFSQPDAPKVASGMELSKALGMVDALEAFIHNVREFAYQEAMAGRCPDGYKLVAKRATRKWRNAEAASKYFAANTALFQGLEIFNAPELKTPAQVEKLLPKDHKKIVSELTVSLSSGFAVVPTADPRPEVKRDAISAFTEPNPELDVMS